MILAYLSAIGLRAELKEGMNHCPIKFLSVSKGLLYM